MAEKALAAQFNRAEHDIVDHNTYVFMGDGCLMEGISHEACSLAGTLGLGKLIAFWDDNGISIDGHVEGWFSDDTPKRFESYGWHVIPAVDGHDADAINAAIEAAKAETDKPTLICTKTVIGFGSPNKSGSHDCHGAPLGTEEIKAAREFLAGSMVLLKFRLRSTPSGMLKQPVLRKKKRGMRSLQHTQPLILSLQQSLNVV